MDKWKKIKCELCLNYFILNIPVYLDKEQQWYEIGKVIDQPAITCSKLSIETLEQGVKYVQN